MRLTLSSKTISKTTAIILLTWFGISIPLLSTAADDKGQFAIRGAGLMPCALFYQEKQAESEVYLIAASWVDGYITGRNQYSDKNYDALSFETTELLMSILEKHCKRNPQDLVFSVISSLLGKLANQRLIQQSEKIEIVAGERKTILYVTTLKRAQQKLQASGYYQGEVTGDYDENTQQALKKFQKSIAFNSTGFPDQLTLWRLFRSE